MSSRQRASQKHFKTARNNEIKNSKYQMTPIKERKKRGSITREEGAERFRVEKCYCPKIPEQEFVPRSPNLT